jgi:uracil-DNA glycosylase
LLKSASFASLNAMDTPVSKSAKLRELKNHLQFLKDYGINEIPLDPNQKLDLDRSSPTHNSTQSNIMLDQVKTELGDCQRCKLCEDRKNIVFGSGNPNADLVFVGEGPGADEDEQGLPFVGRAGKKLTEIIEKGMEISRANDTYICNIVKCRPPGNRDPQSDEIEACKPFLIKQLQAIKPKVIVALGKPAASTLLQRNVPITKERGQWHEFEGIPLMLTLHPAYLLRAYTIENRKAVFEDMKKVLKALGK